MPLIVLGVQPRTLCARLLPRCRGPSSRASEIKIKTTTTCLIATANPHSVKTATSFS